MWSALYSLPRDLPLRPHLHWRRDDQLHWERTSQFRKNANGNSWWWILLMMISNVFPKIAHVIREVRQFQQTPYKIDPILKAAEYLLDPSRRLPDDELYQRSLMIEPRWGEIFWIFLNILLQIFSGFKILKAICLLSVNLNKCSVFFLQSEDWREVKILVITSTLLSVKTQ